MDMFYNLKLFVGLKLLLCIEVKNNEVYENRLFEKYNADKFLQRENCAVRIIP